MNSTNSKTDRTASQKLSRNRKVDAAFAEAVALIEREGVGFEHWDAALILSGLLTVAFVLAGAGDESENK